MRREIGLYGGTFSPPHSGHTEAASQFLRQLHLERLYIIPTAIPPHKTNDPSVEPMYRLEMLRLAFEDHPDYNRRIFISDYEITQKGLSYTVKTIEHFSRLYPINDEFRITLLCGTDMFLTLAEWYQPKRIFELSRIAHIRRILKSKTTDEKIDEYTKYYQTIFNADIVAVEGDVIEISSSDIRNKLSANETSGQFLSQKVYDYIKKNKLYQFHER